jgi:hypothetical protein
LAIESIDNAETPIESMVSVEWTKTGQAYALLNTGKRAAFTVEKPVKQYPATPSQSISAPGHFSAAIPQNFSNSLLRHE